MQQELILFGSSKDSPAFLKFRSDSSFYSSKLSQIRILRSQQRPYGKYRRIVYFNELKSPIPWDSARWPHGHQSKVEATSGARSELVNHSSTGGRFISDHPAPPSDLCILGGAQWRIRTSLRTIIAGTNRRTAFLQLQTVPNDL